VPYTPNAVVTYQFSFEDFTFTYNLAATMTAADVGKAVTQDTTKTNAVRLAVAGEAIFGRLETFEQRTQQGGMLTGAVSRKFRSKLPTTGTVAVGDALVGSATPGVAQTGAAPTGAHNNVVEVGTGYAIVEKL